MAKFHGVVHLDEDRCKGCGLCVTACPKDLLYLDTSRFNLKGYNPVAISDPGACIACAHCALMCPDVVISVERVTSDQLAGVLVH